MAYNNGRYRSLISSYYRKANGIIIIYNVNRRDSFEYANLSLPYLSAAKNLRNDK